MRQRTLWLIALLSLMLLSQTAAAADGGVLNTVVHKFKDAAQLWASTIQGYAVWLFWTLATISLVWTFGFMALRKADIGEFFAEFIRFCLFTGFFLWLLQHGPSYAMSIINSMMTVGSKAGGVALLNPSTPVDVAFDILDKSFKSLSKWNPIDSLAIVLVSIIILICLATIAANVLLVLVTAWIMAYAGMFVLGFGGSRWTSEIALGYFRTIAGLAMKILTMTLLIGIATSLVDEHIATIKAGASMDQLLVICVVSLVLSMLIHTLPNLVAGLIPGGGGAAGAVGSFSGGQVMQSAKDSFNTAKSVAGAALSGGASLMGGIAGGMTGGMQSMYSAFRGGGSGGSGGIEMASQMAGLLGGGSGGAGSSNGGASPLGGAMGLGSSGGMSGMGGAANSAMSSMASAGGQASGGDSSGGGGSSSGSADGGGEGSAGGGSEAGAGSSVGGGSDGGSGGGSDSGGRSGADGGSGGSTSGSSSSSTTTTAASAQGGGGPDASQAASTGSTGSGQIGRAAAGAGASDGGGASKATTASRAAASQASSQASSTSTSGASSSLNTRSGSRSFDPSTEVADFRDSKKEKG